MRNLAQNHHRSAAQQSNGEVKVWGSGMCGLSSMGVTEVVLDGTFVQGKFTTNMLLF